MPVRLPLRHLARGFVHRPRSMKIPPTSVLSRIAAALGVDDLEPQAVAHLTLDRHQLAQGFALVSEATGWQVVMTPESVDVARHQLADQSSPHIQFEDFLPRAGAVLSEFCERGPSYHRLAALSESLFPELPPEAMDKVFRTLMNVPPGFEVSWEWDHRVVATVSRTFGSFDEPTNTIATVKRISGTLGEGRLFDGIRVELDINTSPRNEANRFAGVATTDFFNEAVGWHRDLTSTVLGYIGLAP